MRESEGPGPKSQTNQAMEGGEGMQMHALAECQGLSNSISLSEVRWKPQVVTERSHTAVEHRGEERSGEGRRGGWTAMEREERVTTKAGRTAREKE